ncbi:hypothetical protein PAGU2595_001050 [Lysobacter xanthus]
MVAVASAASADCADVDAAPSRYGPTCAADIGSPDVGFPVARFAFGRIDTRRRAPTPAPATGARVAQDSHGGVKCRRGLPKDAGLMGRRPIGLRRSAVARAVVRAVRRGPAGRAASPAWMRSVPANGTPFGARTRDGGAPFASEPP